MICLVLAFCIWNRTLCTGTNCAAVSSEGEAGDAAAHAGQLAEPALLAFAGELGHLLGHLLHHAELLEQPVHIHHLKPAAGGDKKMQEMLEYLGGY